MQNLREYIYSLMTDKRGGFFASILKALLLVISFFYGISIKAVRFIRQSAAKRLACRVVSIGNLTLGGTGKTPASCMAAEFLKREGHAPAVLIRGYGDDEWKMLKGLLGDIPVLVGRDRIASGAKALSELGADTLILDDGFQHWALKRDLDIVLVDATNPFGNRMLFPRGVLREGLKALGRADIIVLTKTDMARKGLQELKRRLGKMLPGIPILESIHKPVGLYTLKEKDELPISSIRNMNICSLSSIVNTLYFEYLLKDLGANVARGFHYPDHYNYKESDLEYVINESRRLNVDTIITTEKDAVKITSLLLKAYSLKLFVLRVEMKVTNGEEILKDRLRCLYRD